MANRSRGQFDVTIDTGDEVLGFVLARDTGKPAVVPVQMGEGRADEMIRNSDVPRVIDNLDAGMGFSRRVEAVPNGYSHCLPGHTRSPGGIFSPAGKLTPISMAGVAWAGGVNSPIIDSIDFAGNLYLITSGREVLEMAGGTDNPTVAAYGLGSGLFGGQGATVFQDRLWVGGGGSMLYRRLDNFWAQVPSLNRGSLATVTWRPQGIPTQFMVAVAPDSTIRYVSELNDPTVDADWSPPIKIGSADLGINRIVAAPRHAYFLKPDGVYDMDEFGIQAYPIASWVKESIDLGNGLWGFHAGTGLYYAHQQGLAFIPTAGELQHRPIWAQPGYGLPWEGPVRGAPWAGSFEGGLVVVALFDGANSYLCVGGPSEQAYGEATHIWHGAEAYIPGERISHVKTHTAVGASGDVRWPRRLIATTVEGGASVQTKLYWQSLPRAATPIQELLLGGQFEPADASSLFLPADPWGRPSSVKTMLQFDLLAERLTTDADYLRLYAKADDGDYVEQGVAAEGPSTSLTPIELTEGRYITTRIDAVGAPILRSAELRAAIGVELREARIYTLVLGYDNALRTARGRENRDPEHRLAQLRAVLGRVVTLDDGTAMRVRVLQVMPARRQQLGSPRRGGAWMTVAEVMVSILDRPFNWDSGAVFGGPHTWS